MIDHGPGISQQPFCFLFLFLFPGCDPDSAHEQCDGLDIIVRVIGLLVRKTDNGNDMIVFKYRQRHKIMNADMAFRIAFFLWIR
ncbi:hypothetical protein SDC9_176859 [bioreactor metagenome]|uniref:Uncharacterized protein n=1 Tax=bioreactor metagenome TaxID=1076179 RepID=A0A645GT55_9ZZZZ